MIKAIVYTSNSGFTEKYAKILGEDLNIPVHELKKAKVNAQDEIIYMGWLMAGGIKGYKKAIKKYNIVATAAIGMSLPSEKYCNEIIEKNQIKEKLFYLQGGFDKTKLKGIYKFMMNSMEKMIRPNLEAKEDKTPEDIEMLEMMQHSKDCVKKENLNEIISWIKNKE